MKRIVYYLLITLALVSIGLLSGCSKMGGGGDVSIVKNGYLNFDKSITVGQAFDGYKYFKTKEWKATKTEQGRRLVLFSAQMSDEWLNVNNNDGTTKAFGQQVTSQEIQIQFTINQDGTFNLSGTRLLGKRPDGRSPLDSTLSDTNLNRIYANEPLL